VSIRSDTEAELAISLQLPPFLRWMMAAPVALTILFGAQELLFGSAFTGIMLIAVFGGLGGWAFLLVSERADLELDAQAGTVRLVRRTLLGTRVEDFALAALDSAELSRNPRRGSGAIELVVTNTRPATRIRVTGWGTSQGAMATLAQNINDWLAHAKDRQEHG
jgi:hypothetical protein